MENGAFSYRSYVLHIFSQLKKRGTIVQCVHQCKQRDYWQSRREYLTRTEIRFNLCTWLGEISSCSCLTVLPGPAWVLLKSVKIKFHLCMWPSLTAYKNRCCRWRVHSLAGWRNSATPRKKFLADMNLPLLFVLLIATASAQGNVVRLLGCGLPCLIPAICLILLHGPFYKRSSINSYGYTMYSLSLRW